MKKLSKHVGLGLALVLAPLLAPAGDVQRTQSFPPGGSPAGWEAKDNTASGNSFGYSVSHNAGGADAEAGGTVARCGLRAWYADTNFLTTTYNPASILAASFKFIKTGSSALILA